ncbi:hypothetical protein CapIbe_007341 [Capra ibex]
MSRGAERRWGSRSATVGSVAPLPSPTRGLIASAPLLHRTGSSAPSRGHASRPGRVSKGTAVRRRAPLRTQEPDPARVTGRQILLLLQHGPCARLCVRYIP